MNLTEFMDNLFELYPNSWNIGNKKLKLNQYYKVVDKPKIDYAKLMRLIAQEHNDDFMPPAAWLQERLCRCYKTDEINAWRHPKIYNPIYGVVINSDCFPSGTTDEQILATYRKMFPNTEGWRIVE